MKVDTAAIDQEIANYEKQLRQHYSVKAKLAAEIDSLDPVSYTHLDVYKRQELEQRVKAVDMLLKDGTIAVLEQRLKRLEKEGQHRGEERAIA